MHPMQMVYFNFLAKNNVSINYQVDYWGLSSIQAIRKILYYEKNKSKVKELNENLQKQLSKSLDLTFHGVGIRFLLDCMEQVWSQPGCDRR
jgi:hypothetical protein